MTTGKATLAAQEMVARAESTFGENSAAVLDAYQPGQNPRWFMDGFHNVYVLGTLGERSRIGDIKTAQDLTPEQREAAYALGESTAAQRRTTVGRGVKKGMASSAEGKSNLDNIPIRATTPIAQGFSAFPKNDVMYERALRIKPDGNKFDVAMHGTVDSVAFGSDQGNMSARLLADIIRRSKGYHGQDIRLLSCYTGYSMGTEYNFAEELANALGVTVWAPNDLLIIGQYGTISIGIGNSGQMIPYMPNERGRIR